MTRFSVAFPASLCCLWRPPRSAHATVATGSGAGAPSPWCSATRSQKSRRARSAAASSRGSRACPARPRGTTYSHSRARGPRDERPPARRWAFSRSRGGAHWPSSPGDRRGRSVRQRAAGQAQAHRTGLHQLSQAAVQVRCASRLACVDSARCYSSASPSRQLSRLPHADALRAPIHATHARGLIASASSQVRLSAH